MKRRWNVAAATLAAASILALDLVAPGRAAASPAGTANLFSTYSELVPLRQVAEAIGASVEWDQTSYRATVRRGNDFFTIQVGQSNATIGENETKLSRPAVLKEETTYAPLSVIQKAFGADVGWSESGGVVIGKEDAVSLGGRFIRLLQEGRYDDAWQQMSESLRRSLSVSLLQQVWGQLTAAAGTPVELMTAAEESSTVHRSAVLVYKTNKPMPLELTLRTRDGRIDDLYIPAGASGGYRVPDYDHPDRYLEKARTVGQGEFALPATLTVPKGDGPFPAVVLVHGSGPSDRDESVGGYKTFRDLAAGLADQGVAVLRYEKRTREHPLKSSLLPQFSVREETIDDALLAVQSLKAEPEIRKDAIYVLGHSQGGMLVPRILEADAGKSIAGSILLSAPAGPLEDLLLWQLRQAAARAEKAGQPAAEAIQAQADKWQAMVALLKDPRYSTANIPPQFAIQNPYWWFDFRGYKGPELAAGQKGPMLVMQGENDMQVPFSELAVWKQGLASRTDVTYKSYPGLNHFYVASDTPSTGEEYAQPGNVPVSVIDDLAGWIKSPK